MKTQELPADGRALPVSGELSWAVRAAQKRLHELRRHNGIHPHGRPSYYELPITNDELEITKEDTNPPESSPDIRHSSFVKIYPDIALGMLRRKQAAAGRVWTLLRHCDAEGRGRIAIHAATRLLTGDGSPTRICGRRQLANLLAAGDGLFWDRDTGADGGQWLRLRSAARAAAGLGVARLGGSPVAVPLAALTGTIGQARAHLYAAFHSGRTRTDLLTGEKRGRGPIARATLCKLSGATANSQRNYERRAAVDRRSAIAVGPRLGSADEQETAWERGRAMFRLRDREGKYGRPGAVYLAWQLPNEYTGPHATLPRGRMKRLNRALADLFHDGMTGNGEGPRGAEAETSGREAAPGRDHDAAVRLANSAPARLHTPLAIPRRLFYWSAKAAMMARHERERYWRYKGSWLWQPPCEKSDPTATIKTGAASQHLNS